MQSTHTNTFRLAVKATLTAGTGTLEHFNIGAARGKILVAYGAAQFNILEKGHPINDLKARGVFEKDVLFNYRARDDSLLYWDAIHEYVSAIFQEYYGGKFSKLVLS